MTNPAIPTAAEATSAATVSSDRGARLQAGQLVARGPASTDQALTTRGPPPSGNRGATMFRVSMTSPTLRNRSGLRKRSCAVDTTSAS